MRSLPRWLPFCVCLLTWLVFATPASAYPLTPLPTNVSLVAVGDSISAGWGAPAIRGVRVNGYVSQLHRQLLTRGLADLHNLGVPGLTSGQFLFLLDHWPEASHYLKEADIITLSIGGNDIIWTDHQSPGDVLKMREAMTKYEANIDTILTKIRALNPSARVFVLEVYNPFAVDDARHKMLSPWVDWVNDSIIKSGVYHNATVVPTATLFLGHEKECINLANDDIHPNITGHTKIAELISQDLLGTFIPLIVKQKMQPNLLWNGKPTETSAMLVLENETLYIEADQLATLHQGTIRNLWFRIGSWWVKVNGKQVRLPSPVLLKDGHPFLPLRAVSESVGDRVYWVEDSQTMNVLTTP
ncbi:MAG: GDSL-type esterase/lipase family protein [Tumebacillaceae bacterium]